MRAGTYRRFRLAFIVTVFGGLAAAVALEHARPSRSELPVFEPARAVALAPVELPRGEHRLTGRVTSTSGGAVEGVLVELVQDGEPHWTYTDAGGGFLLTGLAEGEVEAALIVEQRHPVRRRATLPGPPVQWTVADRYEPIDGLPEIRRSQLFGTVASPLGRPLGDYQLVFEPTEDNPPLSGVVPRRVRIVNDRLFTITDLALGNYRVYVLPGWADGGSWPRLADQHYQHIASAPELAVVLDSGELSGRLVGEHEEPLEGALVTVWSADAPERVWEPRRTSQDGRFVVHDLPPGDYLAEARAGSTVRRREVSVRPRFRETVDFGPIALRLATDG